MSYTRRHILATAAGAALASAAESSAPVKPTLCLFSKHLPHLDYPELARTLEDLGIPGCDLTVRSGGHVLPENAAKDLPRAHEALQEQGITLPMITTGLTSLDDPAARPTLYTAGELGVTFFKLGYYRYRPVDELEKTLVEVRRDVDGLLGLAQHSKVQGGFHNHSGTYVGAAMWDVFEIIRDIDPRWMGSYFDPCHATIEGGDAGWELGFQRLAPRIKMVAIKDFYWEKQEGEWRVRMCPLGEGMVDFPKFFEMLAATGFSGPISLHVEYEIEASSEKEKQEKELAAIEKDFAYMKSQVEKAFGGVHSA